MQSIWYPTENTVTGFKYATTASLAPLMLLAIVLPALIVFFIYGLFLTLKGIVILRGAITLPINEEGYGESKASEPKKSKTMVMLLPTIGVPLSVIAALFFLFKGDMFGLAIAIIIPMLFLPPCLAKFIKLDRIEKESTKEIAEPISKQI